MEGLSLLPVVRARRLRVVQPPRLGSHTVITTDAIVTDASLWHMLTCECMILFFYLAHSLYRLWWNLLSAMRQAPVPSTMLDAGLHCCGSGLFDECGSCLICVQASRLRWW